MGSLRRGKILPTGSKGPPLPSESREQPALPSHSPSHSHGPSRAPDPANFPRTSPSCGPEEQGSPCSGTLLVCHQLPKVLLPEPNTRAAIILDHVEAQVSCFPPHHLRASPELMIPPAIPSSIISGPVQGSPTTARAGLEAEDGDKGFHTSTRAKGELMAPAWARPGLVSHSQSPCMTQHDQGCGETAGSPWC